MTPFSSSSHPPLLIFTGGHHTGALALAKGLIKKDWHIFWIGHRQSQWSDISDSAEFREVKAAGIEFFDLKAGKIYRTFHPLKLLRLPLGFMVTFYILLKLKFQYGHQLKGIVTFGGYLGVPVAFWGYILGIPVLAHEQTVVAGWANKFISYFARKIAVTWPTSLNFYPSSKVILTGLPLREEILDYLRNTNKSVVADQIYITGGKQGSHIINETIFSVLKNLLKNYILIHQTGSSTLFNDYRHANEIRRTLPEKLQSRYKIRDYLSPEEAATALSSSGLVISRSGAHIIQELALFKTRCVLIPIPWSSHNEQFYNARLLEKNHQAVIIPESQLNGESLFTAIKAAHKLQPAQMHLITDGLEQMIHLIEQMFGKP